MTRPFASYALNFTSNMNKQFATAFPNAAASWGAMYKLVGTAYSPYVSMTEKALRYGTMGLAMYAYADSKHAKYPERGDKVWSDKFGEDEVKLLGGFAGFGLGFKPVATAVKNLGSMTGLGSVASSAVAAASVTATKEAALGKELGEVALSASGKALEKYSHLGMKVGAKVEEVRSGLNPINHAPKATVGTGLEHSKAVHEAWSQMRGALRANRGANEALTETSKQTVNTTQLMKEELRSLHAADKVSLAAEKDAAVEQVAQAKMGL